VALSITITTASTLLAVIATPVISLLYLGKQLDVPAMKMLMDILNIIILPVQLGLLSINSLGAF
jgi:BASS family bile acid:Na+ symporter